MGATAVTCGTVRSLSATLMDTGAPVIPARKLEPGGETMTSKPIPFWRSALSLSMLMHRPTMSRINVTSTEIAKTLIMVRRGRSAADAGLVLSPTDIRNSKGVVMFGRCGRNRSKAGIGRAALGAGAVGAIAAGAFAVGALAVGALAIGSLAVGKAKVKRLEIDELVVGKLTVRER